MDGDGLSLLLTAPRKGYWVLRATINGRRRDIGLGPLDLVTLAEARELAIDMRRDIQRGIDPIEERKRQKIEILPPRLSLIEHVLEDFWKILKKYYLFFINIISILNNKLI